MTSLLQQRCDVSSSYVRCSAALVKCRLHAAGVAMTDVVTAGESMEPWIFLWIFQPWFNSSDHDIKTSLGSMFKRFPFPPEHFR